MGMDTKLFLRAFSPKMMQKAVKTFDRATTVVISVCWSAAGIMMGVAVYTFILSISARHATDTALAAEPVLPKIARKAMDLKTAQTVYDRMQHRFPDITFTVRGQEIAVTTTNGTKFHQWLTALSYIDTISPEFHWSLDEFCVGQCAPAELMHAVLKGEHISFEAPQPDAKN